MAASTITRDTWTNDTGTPSAPNGDGTLVGNAQLQNNIYARVDEMFAGAGSYATFRFGGKVAAEGFGTHSFSAGGTGSNLFRIQNTSAGTTNAAYLAVGNDTLPDLFFVQGMSSTFTASGRLQPSGALLECGGAGGMSIAANHASGILRFYSKGTAEVGRISGPAWFINATANTKNTSGLTVSQVGADDEVLSLKSTDVAHGITSITETDTYGLFKKNSATAGGLYVQSLAASSTIYSLLLEGDSDTETGTRSTAGAGPVEIRAALKSGAGLTAMSADKNMVIITNNGSTRFIFDSDGDSHEHGTGWTAFDDHDDVAMIEALEYELTAAQGNPIDRVFSRWMTHNRRTLARLKLVTFNKDGHHFVNRSRMQNLLCGAIRQLAQRVAALEAA